MKLRVMMIKKSNIKQCQTKRYKTILLFIYFLTTILYVLYSGGILLFTEECRFFKYTEGTLLGKYQILFFVVYSILVSIFLLKKDFRFIISVIVPMFVYAATYIVVDRKIERRLNNEKSIISNAVVITNVTSSRGLGGLNIKYKTGERKMKGSINIHVKTDGIESGDTILIKYLESCSYVVGLYEAYPTKSQLEKCKNECYLINGKLIPVKKE